VTSHDRRIAEAVRDACVAEFSTRADDLRKQAEGVSKGNRGGIMEIVRGLDANAALLRALDVAAVVATVPAAPDAYLDSVARAVMFIDERVTADRVRACAAEVAASLGRPLTMRDARAVIDVALVELAAVAREEFPAGDMARRSIADRVVALFSTSLKA
jgi:hypothetical protein